jgi:hypothetical protein
VVDAIKGANGAVIGEADAMDVVPRVINADELKATSWTPATQ